MALKLYAFFSFTLVATCAFPGARDRIPNGNSVPNPGPQGGIWAGVGHLAAGGGGPRNPFGLDYAASGYEWTDDLCLRDSDGDGRSNGEELGDPNCIWFMGGPDPELPARSHPGVYDQPLQNLPQQPCNTIDAPADTRLLDVAFSEPNDVSGFPRTQYICEQKVVTVPSAEATKYHQIKTEILNNNESVLHHIWIYICDGVDSSDGNKVGQGSYGCSGIEGNCQIIAGWALGASDWCEPENVGVQLEFGPEASKVFKIEAHYDNAMGLIESDQSGMRLHLTTSLRPLESSLVILGMDYYDRQFHIPIGQPDYTLWNICPAAATERLRHPVWVYSWNPHMHLYGKSLVTEHYRCGHKIGEIGRIDDFEFDNQQAYYFQKPIKILPGDALVTMCSYDTADASGPIVGGEETTDEMCDNYLTYYPYAGTWRQPNLFSACSSFDQGQNPAWAGYDDLTPFTTLDVGGDTLIWNYESDPSANLPDCCSANDGGETCEALFRSRLGEPCANDSDCRGRRAQCVGGICTRPSWW